MCEEKKVEDYLGQDGLLYCGKCHTAKQKRLVWQPDSPPSIVPVVCQCQKETLEQQKQQREKEQFRLDMVRRCEDGFCCPDGLRYCFDQDDQSQPKISQVCRQYVQRWPEMQKNNIGILFYGNVGTGKSFLASCIGNGLLEQQVPVAATNFPRLLNLLQGTYSKQQMLDRLAIYPLLILDDLGTERDSAYAAEQIFNIINTRYNCQLPVVITTNLTMEQLEHPGSMQCARIYDRILEMCPICLCMAGQSRRSANAQKRQQLAKELLLQEKVRDEI